MNKSKETLRLPIRATVVVSILTVWCKERFNSLLTDEAGEVHLEVSDKVLLAELEDGGVAVEREEAPLPVGVGVALGRVQRHHVHRVLIVVVVILLIF